LNGDLTVEVSLQTVEQVQRTLIDLAFKFGPKVLAATLILTLGFFVGRYVSRWLDRGLRHIEMEPPVRLLLVRIGRLLVMVVFAIMALQNLGVELLPLIAGLGVAGAGIALAMQGVLGNVVAGLSIIFTKPFRIGEYISIAGEEGMVEDISLFTTRLSHPDRSYVVIPNRKIVGEVLHNYGKIRQLDVVVGVAYDTDINHALSTLREILTANRRVLQELDPVIRTTLLGEFAVNIAVKPWVAVPDFGLANGEINQAILEVFRERGIAIPFPQREVRLLSVAAGRKPPPQ
jgi:small conductance mechanosensitive channel